MATKGTGRIGRARRRRAPADSAVAFNSNIVAHIKTMCSTCNLLELRPPCCGLSVSEMNVVNRLVFNLLPVSRGEILYRTGDRFTSLFAVRNGFFKSTILLQDGWRDQVTGFSMTGEVLGMDGIGSERHTCNATALEDSDVCAIPFAGLEELAHKIPSLQHHFRELMSHEIVREQGVMRLLRSITAGERLALFLLNLSQRFAARGYAPSELHLRMSRKEIGSYLGLALETVSRTFSKFQEEGLIGVQKKFVRILDSAGLKRVGGC